MYTGTDLTGVGFLVFFLTAIFSGLIVGAVAYYGGVTDTQQKAVKAGVAEYVPGEKGEPVFTWKNDLSFEEDQCNGTGSTGPM